MLFCIVSIFNRVYYFGNWKRKISRVQLSRANEKYIFTLVVPTHYVCRFFSTNVLRSTAPSYTRQSCRLRWQVWAYEPTPLAETRADLNLNIYLLLYNNQIDETEIREIFKLRNQTQVSTFSNSLHSTQRIQYSVNTF